MATSLLALLDDITAMTKIAAAKTSGVLGDDLALNAEQVSGVKPERELPVVWAVAKGSMINKVILVPAALLISSVAPWAIIPLLMVGGLFLCFEGFEKLFHKFMGHEAQVEDQIEQATLENALADPNQDLVVLEKSKIKGAIRTDFILSAEIIVISLGTVAESSLVVRIAVLCTIAVLMTIGVYGLVAGIVKIDDLGMKLAASGKPWSILGRGILLAAPWLMTTLSVVGTAAMFLVGGGIIAHGVPAIEQVLHGLAEYAGVLGGVATVALNGLLGVLAGGLVVAGWTLVGKLRGKKQH